MPYDAHSIGDDGDRSQWQPLTEHLVAVSDLAERFAREAQPDDVAFANAASVGGLLHGLGIAPKSSACPPEPSDNELEDVVIARGKSHVRISREDGTLNRDLFDEAAVGHLGLVDRLQVELDGVPNVLPCFFERITLGNAAGKRRHEGRVPAFIGDFEHNF